jgi:hypothetical protein
MAEYFRKYAISHEAIQAQRGSCGGGWPRTGVPGEGRCVQLRI